ncbi:unnamed protein product [Candidula unifasciata]|uniref:Uncharacterized protein n=1 Tax=Candidula unifasciata TaxID=100452 RepID=A0A8S3ZWT1_9EUPU|nr:unnamed protein product [Candidula unifasciata]
MISSNVSWCYSLAGSLRAEENILHVIYDFDKWSFDEILAECHRLLSGHGAGSTARSVLLICKGGPGYLYLLKNFVMTPQKLTNSKYPAMVG